MTRFHTKKIISGALVILGAALLAVAAFLLADFLRATQQGDLIPSGNTITQGGDVSERDPGPVKDNYSVDAHHPRRIDIPKIDVSAYVQPVGVLEEGDMATPSNLFFTGWYVDSASPGDAGLSIINGHAGGRYQHGVFRHLGRLKQDDIIRVQMGNLEWREFAVVSAESYGVAEAGKKLHQAPTEIQELRLITCDGVFDEKHRTYDRRMIVTAKLITP